MKKLFCLMAMLLVCLVFGKELPLTPNDKVEYEKMSALLWKDGAVTEDELKMIQAALAYEGHYHVVCKALEVAIARNAPGLKDMLTTTAATRNYMPKEIAGFFLAMGEPLTIERVTQALQDAKLQYHRSSIYTADDACIDILVAMMLHRARQVDKKPFALPEGIGFEPRHKAMAELAIKPEAEEWDFACSQMKTMKGGPLNPQRMAWVFALSAYSRLFFDEAMASLRSEELGYLARLTIGTYLHNNWRRMTPEQREECKGLDALLQLFTNKLREEVHAAPVKPLTMEERIQEQASVDKVNRILWQEGELTEEDLAKLTAVLNDGESPEAVACTALVTAIVRRMPGLKETLEHVAAQGGHTPKEIAVRFLAMGGAPSIDQLVKVLQKTNGDYEQWPTPIADDYVRDVLVDMLVLRARQGDQEPFDLPEGITFSHRHQAMAKWAVKPEAEAWKFLHGKLLELKGRKAIQEGLNLVLAMAAYSTTFYDEAMKALESEELSNGGKFLIHCHLNGCRGRLTTEQWNAFTTRYPQSAASSWMSKGFNE